MSVQKLDTVSQLVGPFEPISLKGMDKVTLMDRTDMKFILPFQLLEAILEDIKGHYRILTIDERKVFNYHTDYYDTPELVMFFDHHNGKLNRFKIRRREYVESRLSFMEVKFKSNKGRVVKQRIDDRKADTHQINGFLSKNTPYNPIVLQRTLSNHFNRFTLVDNALKERVTTDFNLSFSNNTVHASLNGLVVIEIKQNRTDKDSIIYQALKKYTVRQSSMSKYCIGISMLEEQAKSNNFKRLLLQIKKISHVEYVS
jgi:hypothetical protein